MRAYDGADIKYLLEKRGVSLADVARQAGVTPSCVNHVIWGKGTSQYVVMHIERLLGWKPGRLQIARATNLKAA